jgi:GT2 family glycosyltransferase
VGDPSLSIVVPTLGHAPTLGRVIGGLERQQPKLDAVEVFVCVDRAGSELDLPGATGQSFPVTVLHAERGGASATRNIGWRAASAPLVLFLDDDIVPTPRLVAEHLAWHNASPAPEVGVLGLVRWSPEVAVTPFMRWLEMGIQFDYARIRGIDAGWEHLYSCNVSIRRELLEKVGGFDEERFPFGYEDLDLGVRLARHGFRLMFNRAAEGHHLKTETLDSWRRKLPRIAASEWQFVATYPDRRPYFYELFRAAAAAPVARGRVARLARFIPPTVPWLGQRVWASYQMVCLQALAPDFLAAWGAINSIHGG